MVRVRGLGFGLRLGLVLGLGLKLGLWIGLGIGLGLRAEHQAYELQCARLECNVVLFVQPSIRGYGYNFGIIWFRVT